MANEQVQDLKIHLLGAFKVSGSEVASPRLSNAVRQLVALIAASGPQGISRDQLALELWGDAPPESWMSALRNRLTAARKAIGADTLINHNGRFSFAAFVTIDSWELIGSATNDPTGDAPPLTFLVGETLTGIRASPLVRRHRAEVADARRVLIQQLVTHAPGPLSPLELQTLRSYQRLHPLEPIVTQQVIRAHVLAGELASVSKIMADVTALGAEHDRDTAWIADLAELTSTDVPRRRHDDHDNTPSSASEDDTAAEDDAATTRAELFELAAADGEWSVALEVAMAGLPEEARLAGDPERLRLLEAIPLDKLDPGRQFSYASTLSRHLLYIGRDVEAREWAGTTRSLATTPEQELLAFITSSVVGEAQDERAVIPLPAAFDRASDQAVNMQSLQVAVMSHLERASFEKSARLLGRFNDLVEASADPYRRWHMLLLDSMSRFVDGDLDEAVQVAQRADQYADLFGIVDAEVALIGQLSNARWIHCGFTGPTDYVRELPTGSESTLGQALRALAAHTAGDEQAVNDFVRGFDFNSRSFFTLATLTLVAADITDPDLRRRAFTRLQRRSRTSAIWGSGVMHLGPVDRTLARMVDTATERTEHLTQALRCADRQKTRIWQVVCGLDLALATNDAELLRRSQHLANTPSLQRLITEYEPIPVL